MPKPVTKSTSKPTTKPPFSPSGISSSLQLPDGYQSFDWDWHKDTHLNDPEGLQDALQDDADAGMYLATHHRMVMQDGIIKQQRSSPNWDGGMVTYATCKHLMRTYDKEWEGMWIGGLTPKECGDNTAFLCGKIHRVFNSNAAMGRYLKKKHRSVWNAKRAIHNPRGDVYDVASETSNPWEHTTYTAPTGHTRSEEFYSKSPGSVSDREDGKIPKWWRDMEYKNRQGRRPVLFLLSPVWIFSTPHLWTDYHPGRATLKLTAGEFANSLRSEA